MTLSSFLTRHGTTCPWGLQTVAALGDLWLPPTTLQRPRLLSPTAPFSLFSVDAHIPLPGPAALQRVLEGGHKETVFSQRGDFRQQEEVKQTRAMPGSSEQCDRWHKDGVLQTRVVVAAANNFCIIWCHAYFRLQYQCIVPLYLYWFCGKKVSLHIVHIFQCRVMLFSNCFP